LLRAQALLVRWTFRLRLRERSTFRRRLPRRENRIGSSRRSRRAAEPSTFGAASLRLLKSSIPTIPCGRRASTRPWRSSARRGRKCMPMRSGTASIKSTLGGDPVASHERGTTSPGSSAFNVSVKWSVVPGSHPRPPRLDLQGRANLRMLRFPDRSAAVHTRLPWRRSCRVASSPKPTRRRAMNCRAGWSADTARAFVRLSAESSSSPSRSVSRGRAPILVVARLRPKRKRSASGIARLGPVPRCPRCPCPRITPLPRRYPLRVRVLFSIADHAEHREDVAGSDDADREREDAVEEAVEQETPRVDSGHR
jgi:hypothetical protein